MKVYHLKRVQFLPISQPEAWEFFSSPKNLALITPQRLNFNILSMSGGDKMYAGQIITYKVNVLPLIRMRWVTEISHVHEPEYFTDEQRFGPFSLWHHKHHFRPVDGGVEMTDELDYAVPLGYLGRFANWLFVGREVNGIFEYRNQVLKKHFPERQR